MKKQYKGIFYYTTECTSSMQIDAESKDEAKELLLEKFDRWNKSWIQMGGNPKNLIKVEIEE